MTDHNERRLLRERRFAEFEAQVEAAEAEIAARSQREREVKAEVARMGATSKPSSNSKQSPKGRSLKVIDGSDVKRRPQVATWKPWLIRRKVVVLDADPNAGKSTLSLDIAARVSSGKEMPDGSPGIEGGADVILLSAEDDIDDTIAWRLDIAGADQSRIHHVYAAVDEDGEVPITIPQDLDLLREVIVKYNAALVIVDVFAAYLAESVDSHNDAKIRRVMHPMKMLASETEVSILLLRHLRKAGSDKAIYRGGGSIGIIGAARGGWVIAPHPEDESLRVLAMSKGNLGQPPTPLGFRLKPHELYPDYAYVDWSPGPVEITANRLLEPPPPKTTEEEAENKTKIEICMDALKQILSGPGPHWSNDVLAEIEPLDFNGKTIDTARARLPVRVSKGKRPDGVWGWRMYLPENPPQEPPNEGKNP